MIDDPVAALQQPPWVSGNEFSVEIGD